jgi:hypothetical protein
LKNLFVIFVSRDWQIENFSLIKKRLQQKNSLNEFIFISMDILHRGNASQTLKNYNFPYISCKNSKIDKFFLLTNEVLHLYRKIKTKTWSSINIFIDHNYVPEYFLGLGLASVSGGNLVVFQHSENTLHGWIIDWNRGYINVNLNLRTKIISFFKVKFFLLDLFLKAQIKIKNKNNFHFKKLFRLLFTFKEQFCGCDAYFSFSKIHFNSIKFFLPKYTKHFYVGSLLKEKILNKGKKIKVKLRKNIAKNFIIYSTGVFRTGVITGIKRQIHSLSMIILSLNKLGKIPYVQFKAGELKKEIIKKVMGKFKIKYKNRYNNLSNPCYILPVDSSAVLELRIVQANILLYQTFPITSPFGTQNLFKRDLLIFNYQNNFNETKDKLIKAINNIKDINLKKKNIHYKKNHLSTSAKIVSKFYRYIFC